MTNSLSPMQDNRGRQTKSIFLIIRLCLDISKALLAEAYERMCDENGLARFSTY